VYDEHGALVSGPVVVKLDGGPGRLGKTSHAARARHAARGLIFFPGLQNATSANQEMDGLFGPFKIACSQNAEDIVSERISALGSAVVVGGDGDDGDDGGGEGDDDDDDDLDTGQARGAPVTAAATPQCVRLTNCDLGRIVNGRPTDPVEKRPFELAFTKAKILAAWAKVGAVPLTRAGLLHPKVRSEANGSDPKAKQIRNLAVRHAKAASDLEGVGVKAGPFHVLTVYETTCNLKTWGNEDSGRNALKHD
jgi:hypothetical protein